ncbi:MAG: Crp/Fnr family transcriptional regulator [Chryseobacterium sp.]|nr:MAG: Crp/Fnr family transcriptional regulator [Chryseobacterium sp.]
MSNKIIAKCRVQELKKGDLLNADVLELNVVFISLGVIRGFTMAAGKDITLMISQETQLIGASSLDVFSRSDYALCYQAMEDCCLVLLPIKLLNQLRDQYKQMDAINDRFIWRYHAQATERNLLSRLPTAMLRFSRLMFADPGLFDRVQDKYLSSYLVMRHETLSRLRRLKKKAS